MGLGKNERNVLRTLAEGPARSSDLPVPTGVLRRLEHKGLVTCRGSMPGRATRTSVLVWVLAEPPTASTRLFEEVDPLLRLAQQIVRGFSNRDFDALARLWHPEIEVVTITGRRVRGIERARSLMDDVVAHDSSGLVPGSARRVDDHVLLDGFAVMVPDGARLPVTWVWTFKEGLLWRSRSLVGDRLRTAVRT